MGVCTDVLYCTQYPEWKAQSIRVSWLPRPPISLGGTLDIVGAARGLRPTSAQCLDRGVGDACWSGDADDAFRNGEIGRATEGCATGRCLSSYIHHRSKTVSMGFCNLQMDWCA